MVAPVVVPVVVLLWFLLWVLWWSWCGLAVAPVVVLLWFQLWGILLLGYVAGLMGWGGVTPKTLIVQEVDVSKQIRGRGTSRAKQRVWAEHSAFPI